MPYLHEKALLDSYKRLYMLGNRPYRQKRVQFDEFADGASSAMAGEKDVQKRRQLQASEALKKRQAAEAADREFRDSADREDVDFIKGKPWSADKQAVASGGSLPNQPRFNENPFEIAAKQQKVNSAAELAPVEGRYSFSGLDAAQRDAFVNGSDRLKMKGMVQGGMGNSIPDIDESDPAVHIFPWRFKQ